MEGRCQQLIGSIWCDVLSLRPIRLSSHTSLDAIRLRFNYSNYNLLSTFPLQPPALSSTPVNRRLTCSLDCPLDTGHHCHLPQINLKAQVPRPFISVRTVVFPKERYHFLYLVIRTTTCVRCVRRDHTFLSFQHEYSSGGGLTVIVERPWMQTRARCEVELVTSRGKLAYAKSVFIIYE